MGVSLKLEPNTSWSCWLFFLLPLLAVSWLSPATVTTDMVTAMATDMVTAMATATDTTATMARGRLSLPLLLRLMPSLDMDTTDMATDMATDTDTAMATATDTATAMDMATATTARGRLM